MFSYDELARKYVKHRHVHADVLKTLLTISQVNRGSKVLEIGCGTGNYITALYNANGASAWGIDPSVTMLKEAKQQALQITFEPGKAEGL